jgi:hypothetical protein
MTRPLFYHWTKCPVLGTGSPYSPLPEGLSCSHGCSWRWCRVLEQWPAWLREISLSWCKLPTSSARLQLHFTTFWKGSKSHGHFQLHSLTLVKALYQALNTNNSSWQSKRCYSYSHFMDEEWEDQNLRTCPQSDSWVGMQICAFCWVYLCLCLCHDTMLTLGDPLLGPFPKADSLMSSGGLAHSSVCSYKAPSCLGANSKANAFQSLGQVRSLFKWTKCSI